MSDRSLENRILFLTGKLAESRLRRVLEDLPDRDFDYEVRNIGISVAGLMTADMILRRLQDPGEISQIIVPGLCRGRLEAVEEKFSVPVTRGCVDLKDLPVFFGQQARHIDLDNHRVRIFAEIVDAAELSVQQTLDRAERYRRDGADVIDIGCLPDTPFPHLEETIAALKEQGQRVSVDSLDTNELLRGGRAGVDFLLSLNESTLWIAEEVDAVPVLIPGEHGDMDSLCRAMDLLENRGATYIADAILDPIHFGFTASILRYSDLRKRYPAASIMMGIGNLTELTEADTSGINAILFGIISELDIDNVLATQVSPHACTAIREAELARRIYHAAKLESSLPKGIDDGLLTTHARHPFPYTEDEITQLAKEITDPSYRVQVSPSGIHVYNRDGMQSARDPFAIFPGLKELESDPSHAFYLGVELARAQIALQLGKRYYQDRELLWGVAGRTDREGDED